MARVVGAVERRAQRRMLRTNLVRHEDLHVLADEFGTGIAEQFFALLVGQVDDAVGGDDQERIRARVPARCGRTARFRAAAPGSLSAPLAVSRAGAPAPGSGRGGPGCADCAARLPGSWPRPASLRRTASACACRRAETWQFRARPATIPWRETARRPIGCGAAHPRPDSMRR